MSSEPPSDATARLRPLQAAGDHPPARRRRLRRWLTRGIVIAGLVGFLWMTGCMERLFYQPTAEPTPPSAGPPGAVSTWFESADGTRLHGWWIPAAGVSSPPGQPAASILHVHGNAGNIASHQWFTEYLPAAGFNVLLFDYRGYGQSEGSARRRQPLIEDTHAALDALLARPDVAPDRVGLYGQSLGGSIALNVMADRPEIKAAVIESAFSGWRAIAANAVGGDPPHAVARLVATLLIRDSHRPVDAIARIDRPILILHGADDSIIPVSHGETLAAAAPNARLVTLPGGDHNTLRQTHPEVDELTIEFFRRHLGE